MKIILILLAFFTTLRLYFLSRDTLKANTGTSKWCYPISDYEKRAELKKFGQYFDYNSYQGKENIFPNKFYGFHAGADLEIFSGEANSAVPVYAVTDGTIAFIGPVQGYGNVILLKIYDDLTALYGHVSLKGATFKVGDKVKAGQKLAVLGAAFSADTGGERKHLHFALYKGKGEYFAGYESTQQQLNANWHNPNSYLKSHKAVEPK